MAVGHTAWTKRSPHRCWWTWRLSEVAKRRPDFLARGVMEAVDFAGATSGWAPRRALPAPAMRCAGLGQVTGLLLATHPSVLPKPLNDAGMGLFIHA